MKSKGDKPWTDKYEEVRQIGSGGQGKTKLVYRKEDASHEHPLALKILSQQNDPDRRRRMAREAAALKQISHHAVATIVDDNTDQCESLDVPLYMVTNYIEGETLADYVSRKGSLSFEEALRMLLSILDGLESCHKQGFIHRDIKPGNIVVTAAGSFPVLIDFGLSFNIDEHDETITDTNEELGNRFMYLPELRSRDSGSDAKRDIRSDVATCVGILFYMLTGLQPGMLVDGQDRFPHQREKARVLLQALPVEVLPRLNRVFDKGFQQHLESRFNDVDELRSALIALMNPPANNNEESIRDVIARLTNLGNNQIAGQQVKVLQDINEGVRNAHSQFAVAIENEFIHVSQGGATNTRTPYITQRLGYQYKADPTIKLIIEFEMRIVGTEVVVVARKNGTEDPIWRFEDWKEIGSTSNMQDRIRNYFERSLKAYINEHIDGV